MLQSVRVALVAKNPSPSVLILMGSKNKEFPHDLPGGKIENSETTQEALTREIKEETGLNISEGFQHFRTQEYTNTLGQTITEHLYIVKIDERKEITLSDEHDGYAWVPVLHVDALELEKDVIEEIKRQATDGIYSGNLI